MGNWVFVALVLTWPQVGLSVLLGAACMGLLMAYVLRRQVIKRYD